MDPIPLKRLTNRLAHVSGQIAMSHATLTSLCPPGARRCEAVEELESPVDRHWHLALRASETLQQRLQRLSDRLTNPDADDEDEGPGALESADDDRR